MDTRSALLIVILALTRDAAAACVADGPVATARWIFANEKGFSHYQFPQETKLMKRFLSPGLFGLLEVEWPCQVVSEGSCAVDTDSWTNTEDGRALDPATFELASSQGIRSTVRAQFRFAAGATAKPDTGRATLTLVRDARSGCWLLDDLVGMKGQSLVRQLRSYAAFYP
ncbi:MAG TPA: hypothetical protein VMC02_09415 [Steroidobacteraceae bacterium]|nr:hypothetical protein [Steroidobacteraceae bacterium]